MKTNLLAAASSLVIVLLLQGLPAGAQSTDIPSEARKHFVMGTTLYKDAKTQSDFAEAAAEYLQAANLAPQWTEARNNTAAMFESAGDYAKAIDQSTSETTWVYAPFYLLLFPALTRYVFAK